MSLRGSIYRYGLIVKKLKQKPYSSFEEIRDYIEHQLSFIQMNDEDDDLSIGLSLRTFQREVKNMQQLYGIQIEYSRKEKGYYLADSLHDHTNFERMMDAFDIYNSLNVAQDISPYIIVEKRQQLGVEHLYALLHSIKKRQVIYVDYQKFTDTDSVSRKLNPYAVKEFRNRWYLIALDKSDGLVKTFALDRIKDVRSTFSRFERPQDLDVGKMFESVFGIMNTDSEPEQVILSMNIHQANYLKTLPLHASQTIVSESPEKCIMSLYVRITHDFIMELLSYGADVKVEAPEHLRNKVIKIFSQALKNYQ